MQHSLALMYIMNYRKIAGCPREFTQQVSPKLASLSQATAVLTSYAWRTRSSWLKFSRYEGYTTLFLDSVLTLILSCYQIKDQLPHLKAIVQYKGKLSQQYPNVLEVSGLNFISFVCVSKRANMSLHQWDQFMELGKDVDDNVIEEKIKAQRPEQCALLVYTVSFQQHLMIELVHCYSLTQIVWNNR